MEGDPQSTLKCLSCSSGRKCVRQIPPRVEGAMFSISFWHVEQMTCSKRERRREHLRTTQNNSIQLIGMVTPVYSSPQHVWIQVGRIGVGAASLSISTGAYWDKTVKTKIVILILIFCWNISLTGVIATHFVM
jgi:hypothetical protein